MVALACNWRRVSASELVFVLLLCIYSCLDLHMSTLPMTLNDLPYHVKTSPIDTNSDNHSMTESKLQLMTVFHFCCVGNEAINVLCRKTFLSQSTENVLHDCAFLCDTYRHYGAIE